jgi:hypothetical protein
MLHAHWLERQKLMAYPTVEQSWHWAQGGCRYINSGRCRKTHWRGNSELKRHHPRGNTFGDLRVNSDCTGTASFTEIDQFGDNIAAKVSAVWDDNMRQLRFLFTSVSLNGNPRSIIVNGDARKVVP